MNTFPLAIAIHDQAQAWEAVWKTLTEVSPGFANRPESGIGCVIREIRRLASTSTQPNEIAQPVQPGHQQELDRFFRQVIYGDYMGDNPDDHSLQMRPMEYGVFIRSKDGTEGFAEMSQPASELEQQNQQLRDQNTALDARCARLEEATTQPADAQIAGIALANGFTLKQQPDGKMALNPHVFDFARSLLMQSRPPAIHWANLADREIDVICKHWGTESRQACLDMQAVLKDKNATQPVPPATITWNADGVRTVNGVPDYAQPVPPESKA